MQTSVKELEEVSVSEPKTLVHCSDGAGRTGVFILCETLIAMIENNLVSV